MVAGLVEHFRGIRAAIESAGGRKAAQIPDEVTRNAQVESFTMHLRQLLEFLYSDRPKRPDGAVPPTTSTSRRRGRCCDPPRRRAQPSSGRVGKGVVHLTYARLDADKTWLIDVWYDSRGRSFAESASSERLPSAVRARILGYLVVGSNPSMPASFLASIPVEKVAREDIGSACAR
jgi:hypothetical protein